MCQIDEYVTYLKAQGYTAAAITDHGNINGAINFCKACERESIKPIIGCEFYVAKEMAVHEKARMHVTVIAQSKEGYQNLCRLTAEASLKGFYFKPRIDLPLLKKYKKGLIVLSGCTSGIINKPFLEGDKTLMFENLKFMMENFKKKFYLELLPIDMGEQVKANINLISLSNRYNLPLVATNDVHYLRKGDDKFQEMLLCISDKKQMSDPTRFKFDVTSLYVITEKEMQAAFKKNHPKLPAAAITAAIKNTGVIADQCEAYTLKGYNIFPKVEFLKGRHKSADEHLKFLVAKEMKGRKFDKIKKYKDRLKEEMDQILEKGFTDYFLLVKDIIDWAQKEKIMVGPGRGSSAGSLVCFLLGITSIDPLVYETLFFRFIDPNRNDIPDIDVDFQDDRRQDVKDYIVRRYGRENVSDIGTFGRLKGKLVLKDLCRIYGVPAWEVNQVTPYILERSSADARASYTVEDAFLQFDVCKKFKAKYPHIIEAAAKLEGQVKQYGISAAGVLITDKPVVNYCPIEARGRNKSPCIGYDYRDVGYLGLLKLDVLGINFLTIINHTLEDLKKKKINIDIFSLIPDDKAVFKAIAEKHCVGIFQFETPVMNKIAKAIHIDNFDEMVACNAIVRPGPFRSGSTVSYIAKKQGKQKITYLNQIHKDITEETKGELLYQEQIMLLVRRIGKFDWKDTNIIRRCMSKSEGVERMAKYEELFVKGAADNGIEEREARRIWKETSFYGAWSFNKSHSVAYTMISYWCAWLKHHYPNEYMLNFINYNTNQNRIFEGVREFKSLGYNIIPPRAESAAFLMALARGKKKTVQLGLKDVKGIGEKAIVELEKGTSAKTLDAWIKKVNKRVIHKGIIKVLVNIGFFEKWKGIPQLIKYFNLEYKPDESTDPQDWLYDTCSILYCDNILKRYEAFLDKHINKDIKWDELCSIDAGDESTTKGQWVLLKGLMDTINLKNKELKTGGKGGLEYGRQDIEANAETRYCVSDFFDGTGYLRISFYPEIYAKYEKEIWNSKNASPVILRGTIGPDRIYVKQFINVKSWVSGKNYDAPFAEKLRQGIKNQEEIAAVVKDIVVNIDKVYPVKLERIREHQAKNGLMAFTTMAFQEDVKLEVIIWSKAFIRTRSLFKIGAALNIRFSYFKEGKFYLDGVHSKVEKG